jgi:hypothetical protein
MSDHEDVPLNFNQTECHKVFKVTAKCNKNRNVYTWWTVHAIGQGWANSGPLREFLWPAKTARKIRLEPRFPSHARPKIPDLKKIVEKCDKVHLSH